jgi:hypothetical protein
MLLGSISSFLILYVQSKNQISDFEELRNFNSDYFVKPSSNILRRNIEENHNYFENLSLTNLGDNVKQNNIVNLARLISLLTTNTSEYIRMLNEDDKFSFLAIQRKESLIDRLNNLQSESIDNIKLFYELNEDDISYLTNAHKNLNISRERQQEIWSKLRPDIYELEWTEISEIHGRVNDDFRTLSLIISDISSELNEQIQLNLTDIQLKIENAIKFILIFGVLQSIFYFLIFYLDRKYGDVKNLPIVNKSSFYVASIIFYLFIPASVFLYVNEFKEEQNNLKIFENDTLYYESQEIDQDLKRIRNTIEKFVSQYNNYVFSQPQNMNYALSVFEFPYMNAINAHLKFVIQNPSTEIILSNDDFPITKQLIGNSDSNASFQTINGDLNALNIELSWVQRMLSERRSEYFNSNYILDENNYELNNFSLGLLVLLTFIEIIGSLILISYIIPRKE